MQTPNFSTDDLRPGSRVICPNGTPGVISSFSFAHAWVRITEHEVRFERVSDLRPAPTSEVA